MLQRLGPGGIVVRVGCSGLFEGWVSESGCLDAGVLVRLGTLSSEEAVGWLRSEARE